MAIGDKALARNLRLTPGTALAKDIDDEINRVLDYLADEITARLAADGGKVDKPADGAAMARREPGSAHSIGFFTSSDSTLYFRPDAATAQYDRRVAMFAELPTIPSDVARTPAVEAAQSRADEANGNATNARQGNLYTDSYNRQLAGTRRTAWLQDNGQLGYAASSERYKKYVRALEVTDEQVLALALVTYQWRAAVADDQHREAGLIAERLVENDMAWACFFNDDGTVEGINYEMVGIALIPAVQRLIARTHRLEDDLDLAYQQIDSRLTVLEAK